MRYFFSRKRSFFICIILLVSLLSSCNFSDKTNPTKSANSEKTENPNTTIKYWMELHNNLINTVTNFGETPFAKALKEATGINVEYIHPPVGQASEKFSLMVASGDLPDIIEYSWQRFPGGPVKAINDSIILELNSLMASSAPNLSNYLRSNPAIDKQVQTDDGKYYVFPFIRDDKYLQYTSGPIVRKDWLKDLNMPIPETIHDWYQMLKAFKEEKGATAALSCQFKKDDETQTMTSDIPRIFTGAFKFTSYFFVEKGKVNYGPIQPGVKDYFATMAKWYKEGLIDKNFVSTDAKALASNIINSKTGATFGSGGGGIGAWLPTLKEKDPNADLAAAKYAVAKSGDISQYGTSSNEYTVSPGHAAITKNCKTPKLAAKLLDYAYGKKGHILFNFGKLGESHTIVDNSPKYTNLIMKNPDKLTVAQAMSKYTRGNTNGPFVQDKRYINQFYALQEQKDALIKWSDNKHKTTLLPPITPTSEESGEMASIMKDIQTYIDEQTIKFINGNEPIDNYDKYVKNIKKMGIDKATKIMQAGLDRYNKRR